MRSPPSYWRSGVKVCLCDPESCFVRAILPLLIFPKTYFPQEEPKNEQMAFLTK